MIRVTPFDRGGSAYVQIAFVVAILVVLGAGCASDSGLPMTEPAQVSPTAPPTSLPPEPTPTSAPTALPTPDARPSPTVPAFPTLTPEPTPTAIPFEERLLDGAELDRVRQGERLCVTGVAEDDVLVLRSGPDEDSKQRGTLGSQTCAVWWTGEIKESTWIRVAAFAMRDSDVHVRQGWARREFLVPLEQVDRPNATVASIFSSSFPVENGSEIFDGSSCGPRDDGLVECGITLRTWRSVENVCNRLGWSNWESVGGGSITLGRDNGAWVAVEQRVIVASC